MSAPLHPARLLHPALPLAALLLSACGSEAPSPTPTAPAPPTEAAPVTATTAPPAAVSPAARPLDTAALRARAAASLAANRLYAPAGDNAVEDYLELRERLGSEATVETALIDLAPYVVIGSEQAMAAGAFDEAERLLALLQRMDAEAPALPRLREALVAARAEAERRAAAEAVAQQARAAQAAAVPPTPLSPPPPTASVVPPPATAALPAAPAPGTTGRATPPPAPAPAPSPAREPPPVAPRALLSRVPPRFPEAAQRRRLEGEVELLLTIAPDGSVEGVDVLRAEPPGVFDREAVLAARRWRYAPAEDRSTARVRLSFRRPD